MTRTQELYQQAKDFINDYSDNDGVYNGKEYPQAVREKLVELIVQECIDNLFFHGYNEAANQLEWLKVNRGFTV